MVGRTLLTAKIPSVFNLLTRIMLTFYVLSCFLALVAEMVKSGPTGATKSKLGKNLYTDSRVEKAIQDIGN